MWGQFESNCCPPLIVISMRESKTGLGQGLALKDSPFVSWHPNWDFSKLVLISFQNSFHVFDMNERWKSEYRERHDLETLTSQSDTISPIRIDILIFVKQSCRDCTKFDITWSHLSWHLNWPGSKGAPLEMSATSCWEAPIIVFCSHTTKQCQTPHVNPQEHRVVLQS